MKNMNYKNWIAAGFMENFKIRYTIINSYFTFLFFIPSFQ